MRILAGFVSARGVSLRDLPEDLKIPPRFFRGPVEAMSA